MGNSAPLPPCRSAEGHRIQASVTGGGYFVCVRCWHRFVCPGCRPGAQRWHPVFWCEKHRRVSS